MGDFKFTIDVTYNQIDLSQVDVPMKQIADKIAVEAQRNIRTQTTPEGHTFQALAQSTIRKKKRLNQPLKALIAKGIMYRAIHAYRVNKNVYAVGVIPRGVPQRDLVALIHQEVGAGETRVTRPFLGISKKIEEYAYHRMERWIKERFEKATIKKFSIKLT